MKCKPIGMPQEFKPDNCPLNCGLDMSSACPQILYHALERGAHIFRESNSRSGQDDIHFRGTSPLLSTHPLGRSCTWSKLTISGLSRMIFNMLFITRLTRKPLDLWALKSKPCFFFLHQEHRPKQFNCRFINNFRGQLLAGAGENMVAAYVNVPNCTQMSGTRRVLQGQKIEESYGSVQRPSYPYFANERTDKP